MNDYYVAINVRSRQLYTASAMPHMHGLIPSHQYRFFYQMDGYDCRLMVGYGNQIPHIDSTASQ